MRPHNPPVLFGESLLDEDLPDVIHREHPPDTRCWFRPAVTMRWPSGGGLSSPNCIGMSLECSEQAAISSILDPRCMVRTRSDDALAVGGKRVSPIGITSV
jgi:hypothetical protein